MTQFVEDAIALLETCGLSNIMLIVLVSWALAIEGFFVVDVDDDASNIQDEVNKQLGLSGDDRYRIELTSEMFNYLWALWADFHLYITRPEPHAINPPKRLEPEYLETLKRHEYVYPILDFGTRLSTSRGEDVIKGQRCMTKLFNTIEKMVRILVKRMYGNEEGEGGQAAESPEVRVAFAGHLECKRKAFESIINLRQNVVVTNFEPGEWGDLHLKTVREMAERGYGLPKPSPRGPR